MATLISHCCNSCYYYSRPETMASTSGHRGRRLGLRHGWSISSFLLSLMTLSTTTITLVSALSGGVVVLQRETIADEAHDQQGIVMTDYTHHRLTQEDILTTNRPMIKVPFGRKYALDPVSDLAVQVRPGDRCTVRVLGDTDRLAMRPGRLWPASFPCDFRSGHVTYTHLGGREPGEDRVRLQIRYDSDTDTVILPFTLEVDVSFVQLEIVTKNMPIVTDELGGRSNPIDNSTLQFTYNRASELCRVTVMAGAQGLPRYGQVIGNGPMIGQDCDDFLRSGVTYAHTAGRTSADRDWIPMTVEVVNRDGGGGKPEVRQEYFRILVRIRDGTYNTPPKLSDSATLNMDVNQFILTAITPQTLAAYDEETPAERLIFNITKPPSYGEGYIVSTADSHRPIHSFSQMDLQDLTITYRPPSSDSNTQRIVQVRVQAVDEQGITSAEIPLSIVVKPKNTLAPISTRNTGLQLFEGQSRPITSRQNLEISDEDDLSNVQIKVVEGLRHGQLWVNGFPSRSFTPADLDAGVVRYSHDHSDTYSDNIIFKMYDGDRNFVEFLFPITIYPIDDEAPVLSVNVGLVVSKNISIPLTPALLSSTDVDSNDYAIKYTLKPADRLLGSRFTRRQLKKPTEDLHRWTEINGYYERPVTEWTQGDVVEGRIFYHHVGSRSSPSHMLVERIPFTVSDDAKPPNESVLHEFVVQIIPSDDEPPTVFDSSVSLQMTVEEKSIVPISRRNLRYTDAFANDRLLKFTLLSLPEDTEEDIPGLGGRVVLCDDPEMDVRTFTQAQINHHKICYRAPDLELGLTPHLVQFHFKVEDPSGNTLDGQTFTIHLQPVDDVAPRVTINTLAVRENGQATLGLDTVDITDPDTPPDRLHLVLTDEPSHGELSLDGRPVVQGQVLSPQHLSQGRVVYRNTPGGEAEEDTFAFDATDGLHHVALVVPVSIQLVDDERPSIVLPLGKLGIAMSVKENDRIQISSRDLRAHDPDTDDMSLIFNVEGGPYQGVVTLNGRASKEFSQRDVAEGRVHYRHTSGEIGQTEQVDVFNLTVSDRSTAGWVLAGGSHLVTGVTVSVIILPIDDKSPTVSATRGILKVREGGSATVNANHITIIDQDTPHAALRCSIVTQPALGYLENIAPLRGSEISQKGKRIVTFTADDLVSSNLNYVQSHHKGIEPTDDIFMFQCSDPAGNTSPVVAFAVVIEPTNDEVPELFAREFIVREGDRLIIDVPLLNALDADRPMDELFFTVSQHPVHGSIIKQKVTQNRDITSFKNTDIIDGSIMYEHDDSETTQDSFRIQVSDGRHQVEKDIMVIILPVDDETPRLTINTGLDVRAGETKPITNQELKATDLDSPNTNITYAVRKLPSFGHLQMEINGVFQNMTRGMTFKQQDIDANLIRYQHHSGQSDARDLIKFDISDGHNMLIDRYFYVSIEDLDESFPEVTNRLVKLPEGGSVVLTTDLLSSTDSYNDASQIRFTVTRPPDHGFVENADAPGIPVSTFTQLDLAGNKIRYVHLAEDEETTDNFSFEVSDGSNHVRRTLRVSVSPVDNKKPVLMVEPLKVLEAGEKVITPFELRAMDSDTVDERLEFWITKPPLHGQLLFNHTQMASQFTMSDVNANLISYRHDATETRGDSFKLRLTDGTHHDFYVFPETKRTTWHAQTVEIEILPVDNGIPYVSVNAGGSELQELVGLGAGLELSPRILEAGDRDSPADQLVYTVTTPPLHGELTNINTGQAITEWTQGEMDPGWIVYLLRPGTNVTEDHFVFSVTDPGGNELTDQEFALRWAWLSLESPSIDVDEDQGDLEVKVKRRGSLEHTAFVTVTAIDGTALAGRDFEMPVSTQVQLAPGEEEKTFRLRLVSDGVYEATEYFTLQLHSPVTAALEAPLATTVRINDSRDESVVSLGVSRLEVREDTGEALVPILRTGDVSDELQVICYTQQGSATGTVPHAVMSFSDYITRSRDHYSIIRFDKGQHNVFCPVTIIDDSLYEDSESFYVLLGDPLGGQLGPQNRTEVIILKDEEDKPVVYFGRGHHNVDESVGEVDILLWRAGTDLTRPAQVTVRSRPHPDVNHPAQVGVDYVGVHRVVRFRPGESLRQLKVKIVDDLGVVTLEGLRSFQLVLTMPRNVTLGHPGATTITINDSASDLPHVRFARKAYTVSETEGQITVVIVRSGDLSYATSVRCFTRQATALVAEDFSERPDTDASLITFMPGQREADCTVRILPDRAHEGEEKFYLVLGTPRSSAPGGARLKQPSRTAITITDEADKSVVMFGETRFVIREPLSVDRVTRVTIPVMRVGDISHPAVVRVYTRDGTAQAAKDYIGFSKELTFAPGVTSQEVEVVILYDDEVELREAFTVLLTHDKNRGAKVKNNRAVVFVEEMTGWADVTFPSPPVVVSLRDYDKVDIGAKQPPAGYPVICVTACDAKYPDYKDITHGICQRAGVNNSLTQYRWRVAPPPSTNGLRDDLTNLETNTFFTSVNSATLDSIFFSPGSQVSCAARAVNRGGEPGLELSSPPVTISPTGGTCPSHSPGAVGAQPFHASISYTGSEDEDHPNMVAIKVRIPHTDGLIPVISTQPITNLEFALSDSAFRVAQHVCSNLLTPSEVTTGHGFVDYGHAYGKGPTAAWAHRLPYETDLRLRTNNTVNFYRALDLESCVWQFEGYYGLSELVNMCGGTSSSVGQVLDLTQSFFRVSIPLYVSYVYFSSSLLRQWAHYDVDTTLRLTFVYNTAVTWRRAVMPSGGGQFQGRLHPIRMQINSEGRLVVTLESEALFRGQFVTRYSGTNLESSVSCPDKPSHTFAINLLRSDSTYDQPRQTWQFTSDLVEADYTCAYVVSLVPCVVPRELKFGGPPTCRPHSPVTFTLPLRLQQVNRPVDTNLTLEGELRVMRKRSAWLDAVSSKKRPDVLDPSDMTFSPDDTVYGLIKVGSDPLDPGFKVSLEKVFVCTGVEDQIPHYDPENGQYGCLGPNSQLLHTIRVLDKGTPTAINTRFQGADFEARFASEDSATNELAKASGIDGFSFSARPLFKVDPGHHWFLHTIYTIQSSRVHRGRRAVADDHLDADIPLNTKTLHSHIATFNNPMAETKYLTSQLKNHPTNKHQYSGKGHNGSNSKGKKHLQNKDGRRKSGKGHHHQGKSTGGRHHRHDNYHHKAPSPMVTHSQLLEEEKEKSRWLSSPSYLSSSEKEMSSATISTNRRVHIAHSSPLHTRSKDVVAPTTNKDGGVRTSSQRHKRGLPDISALGQSWSGTGTNMVVLALDYSNTIASGVGSDHANRLYGSNMAGEAELLQGILDGGNGEPNKSGPQVALVAGLSTAFIVLVATILVAITVARYNCLYNTEEDSQNGADTASSGCNITNAPDNSCHQGTPVDSGSTSSTSSSSSSSNIPLPSLPPPSMQQHNQHQQLCGKVTQV